LPFAEVNQAIEPSTTEQTWDEHIKIDHTTVSAILSFETSFDIIAVNQNGNGLAYLNFIRHSDSPYGRLGKSLLKGGVDC
jgi:hypothetical protein